MNNDNVYIIRLDNQFLARIGERLVNFGSYQKRMVIEIDRNIGESLVQTQPSIYALVDPSTLRIAPLKRTTSPTPKELSLSLAQTVEKSGIFLKDLADALRSTHGNVFPMTGALTLEEIVADVETRAMTVIDNNSWARLMNDLTALRAEVAELRTRGIPLPGYEAHREPEPTSESGRVRGRPRES